MLSREQVAQLLGYRTPAKFSAQRERLGFPKPDCYLTSGGRPRAYWSPETFAAWLDRRAATVWRRRWRPAIESAIPREAATPAKEGRDG